METSRVTEINEQQLKKSELIEEFGMNLESEDNLSPLAARMLAYLIVDNHKGVTFEDMVDFLKASKSSVFTNLNILINRRRITYYTLPGDRKKYYTISPDDIMDRMDERIRSCEQKTKICHQIIDYKKEYVNPELKPCISKQVSYLESFIGFMDQYKALCQQYKEDIIKLKK